MAANLDVRQIRTAVFNSAGQSAVVANTESCSMRDTGLLEAHRRYRRAAAFWKHPSPPSLPPVSVQPS